MTKYERREIIQSKTIFGYRVSYYTTTSILRLHDMQRFPVYNILRTLTSRDLLIHRPYAWVFTYIFVLKYKRIFPIKYTEVIQ